MPFTKISAAVMVPAGQDQVWQLAMDWSRQQDWIWATRVRGGASAGAQVVARTGIGRVGFTDTMVITEWDPPRRCVVRHTGKVVRGLGIFEVTQHGQLTEFRWTEQLTLPWPLSGHLGRYLIAPPARLGLRASLRRFARLL